MSATLTKPASTTAYFRNSRPRRPTDVTSCASTREPSAAKSMSLSAIVQGLSGARPWKNCRIVSQMETATNTNTFGLASRIRPIFYPICVLPQDNRSQADDRPGIGPAISTAHGCRNRQCEAFQRGQDFGVWLGLIRSTVFDG